MNREGYIMLSQSAEQVRASQALYFHVFDKDDGAQGVGLQEWSNGIDAFVIDFQCYTGGTEEFCIEREDPAAEEGFPLLSPEDPDIELRFYANRFTQKGDLKDPDVPTENHDCPGGQGTFDDASVPKDVRYAVVYLEEGIPQGVEIDNLPFGPYTEKFRFMLVP